MAYYIVRDGEAVGPFDEAALHAMAAGGELGAETLVWTDGMADWAPAESVPRVAEILRGEIAPVEDDGGQPPVEAGAMSADAAPRGETVPLGQQSEPLPRSTQSQAQPEASEPQSRPSWIQPYATRPGTVPYRIDDGLREGWNAWKEHPIRAVVALLLYAVLAFSLTALPAFVPIPEAVQEAVPGTPEAFDADAFPDSPVGQVRRAVAEYFHTLSTSPLRLGLQAVGLLLTLALSAGLHRFHLRHLREESVSPLAIFAGLSRPLSVGIAFILYYALLLVGLLFFVLPGIWLMVRFMYAPLAIVDQKLGPIAGLRESARVVSALGWWQSFGVLCSSAAIGAFGMLWFLVGGLITLPVAIASWAAAYDTAVANLGRRG